MSTLALRESGGAFRAAEGGKWSATLLTPGRGSSGTYSEAVLERDAPIAFKKGMKLWWGHPKNDEGPGDRDPRDQWGVLDEDASYVPGEGIVGKVRLLPHWKDVVESLGDQASLSIYAMGESDDEGNVTALLESATNSVDIVSYPGREGSGLKKKLEAARAASPKPAAESSAEEKEKTMELKDVIDAIEALAAKFDAFMTESKNAEEKAAQAKVDAEAIEAAVKSAFDAYEEKAKAVKDADIFDHQAEEILEAARTGADVAPLIEKAKKDKAAALAVAKPLTESFGSFIVHEAATDAVVDLSLNLGGKN